MQEKACGEPSEKYSFCETPGLKDIAAEFPVTDQPGRAKLNYTNPQFRRQRRTNRWAEGNDRIRDRNRLFRCNPGHARNVIRILSPDISFRVTSAFSFGG